MKAICFALVLPLALPAEAARLKVLVSATPARTVVQDRCPCEMEVIAGAELPPQITTSYPGTAAISITGGMKPYNIIWHDLPGDGLMGVSAMPGMHRVTVVDAAGEHVTRRVWVGNVRVAHRMRPCPCAPAPVRLREPRDQVAPPKISSDRTVDPPAPPDPDRPLPGPRKDHGGRVTGDGTDHGGGHDTYDHERRRHEPGTGGGGRPTHSPAGRTPGTNSDSGGTRSSPVRSKPSVSGR